MQTQVGELQQMANAADASLKALEGRTAATESNLKALDGRVATAEQRMAALNEEALARARASQTGSQFLMSTVLKDDRIKFSSGRAELSAEGGAELDKLFARLKSDNRPVFLEIQGHTDSIGDGEVNQRLGQARAEAVRQHLARAGMPLNRMATISYGESAPVADNGKREGRSQNRRVQLVVMK